MESPATLLLAFAGIVAGLRTAILFSQWALGHSIHPATRLAVALSLWAAIHTITGLLLARMGVWSIPAMAAALIPLWAGVELFGQVRSQRGPLQRKIHRQAALPLSVVGLLLGALFILQIFHHEDLLGERDGGVYGAIGVTVARTGQFGWTEPLVRDHGIGQVWRSMQFLADKYHQHPRFLLYPGFYLNESTAYIIPQFLGGYETWLAWAYGLGGDDLLVRWNSLLLLVGLLVFYGFIRAVAPSKVAFSALAFALAILALHWHGRSNANETITLLLIWGALTVSLLLHRGRSNPGLPWILGLIVTAVTVVKLAAWFLVPFLALSFGYRARQLGSQAWRCGGILVLAAALAVTHAAVFCSYYLYGSYIHTLAGQGIPYAVLLGGFPLGVWGAYFLGILLAQLSGLVQRQIPELAPVWRSWIERFLLMTVTVVIVSAMIRQNDTALRRMDIWSNEANLAELGDYMPFGMALFGFLGLVLLVLRIAAPYRFLGWLLITLAASIIYNRNLDAVHPWASRRWVPIVFPLLCLGLAYGLDYGIRRMMRIAGDQGGQVRGFFYRLMVIASFMVLLAPGWPLITSQHGWGVRLAAAQLAKAVGEDTLVLSLPRADIRSWGPWLTTHHGIRLYPIAGEKAAWSDMSTVLAKAQARGKRIVYLTNHNPLPWTEEQGFLRLLETTHLHFFSQDETFRSLPETGATFYHKTFSAYEITTAGLRRGWTPHHPVPPPDSVVRNWTLDPLTFNSTAKLPELEGVYDGLLLSQSEKYRGQFWSQGSSRLYLGEYLRSFSDLRPESTAIWGFQVSLTVAAEAPWREGAQTQIHFSPSRNGISKPLWAGLIGPNKTTLVFKVPLWKIQPLSFIEWNSLRVPIVEENRSGALGLRFYQLTIEPIGL
jgi:hypothetical protein